MIVVSVRVYMQNICIINYINKKCYKKFKSIPLPISNKNNNL